MLNRFEHRPRWCTVNAANKILFVVFCILIGLVIGSSIGLLLQQDIIYYPDSARDFLLLREITTTNPIMLIGQRTGISGLYHGPLWLYMNVPAFIIGKGSPVVMGYFWVLLYIAIIGATYWCTMRISGSFFAGLLAALFVAISYGYHVPFMYNPHGALLVTPFFFYACVEYVKSRKPVFAWIAFITLGFIIQFEMAFGVPVAVLLCGYVAGYALKQRQWGLLLPVLGVLPGLSTFILFDLTHGMAQTKSVIAFFTPGGERTPLIVVWHLQQRVKMMVGDGLYDLTKGNVILSVLFLAWCVVEYKKPVVQVFLFLFLGFWLLAFRYTGMMWVFYHWMLHLMAIMTMATLATSHRRKNYALLLVVPFFVVAATAHLDFIQGLSDFSGKSLASWKYHHTVAEAAMKSSREKVIGYFVFTSDMTGYPERYAMEYTARNRGLEARYNEKHPDTYLILFPTQDTRLNARWWREHMVRIAREPDSVLTFNHQLQVYHYRLSSEEQSYAADSSLTNNLLFR